MTFQDFLERCDAELRREDPIQKYDQDAESVPPLSRSHIFHLGDDEKVREVVKEIQDDLTSDMSARIPMPFTDVAMVSRLGGRWVMDRLIEAFEPWRMVDWKGTKFSQKFMVVRHIEDSKEPFAWACGFLGMVDDKISFETVCPFEGLVKMELGDAPARAFAREIEVNTGAILIQATMISHPMNYLVRVTPPLSPKEERRAREGAPRPIRKAAHFIVVDHEVLVGMSPNRGGTHASPVPHHRRGHWMRLAERCRAARGRGEERVWVRPTYVGEREFSDDGGNRYEVMLDIGSKAVAASE